jgi:RHS repeat-associated protein
VESRTIPGGAWIMVQRRAFLYDGWNCIAEYDYIPAGAGATRTLYRSQVWGMSLAPGGAGGLLIIHRHTGLPGTHAATHDGNGNVTALVDAATGTKSARYEYDPFGQLLRATGPAAAENPYRFSTQYTDDITGLIYYGYRHYDPVHGRWLSRDPIGEAGGLNLYGMVGNDPVNGIDVMGLYDEGGHYYAVWLALINNGKLAQDAAEIAYYAQLPDENWLFDAQSGYLFATGYRRADAFALNAPSKAMLEAHFITNLGKGTTASDVIDFTRDVQEVLHQLHGGFIGDIQKIRSCILNKLESPLLQTWERGFLLHMLGDSYAHIRNVEVQISKFMLPILSAQAYEYPFGHKSPSVNDRMIPFCEGSAGCPDVPGNGSEKFRAYLETLNEAAQLPRPRIVGNSQWINDLLNDSSAMSAGRSWLFGKNDSNTAIAEFAKTKFFYSSHYRPENGRIEMNGTYPTPDARRVRDFLKTFRCECMNMIK